MRVGNFWGDDLRRLIEIKRLLYIYMADFVATEILCGCRCAPPVRSDVISSLSYGGSDR